MLTITVTSDSTPKELRIAADALIALAGHTVPDLQMQLPLPLSITPEMLAASPPPPPLPVAVVETPVFAPPPEPVSLNGVELDADGLPYDARIHSGGKMKNSDGRWRKMRGVSEVLVAQVTAELKALVERTRAAPPAELDPVAAFAPQPPAAVSAEPPPAPVPVVAAPVFVPPPPIPADTGDTPTSFVTLMPKIVALMGQQKISQAQIHSVLTLCGVPGLAGLSAAANLDPTVIPKVWEGIQAVVNP